VVGTENMPAACAYDILGEDGDSDGVGEYGYPGPLTSGLGMTKESFGGVLAFTLGIVGGAIGDTGRLSGVIYLRAAKVDCFGLFCGTALIVVY
jgi:hypothetical protein